MAGLVVRTLIIALGIGLASKLIPGVEVEGAGTVLVAALLLGLVNALIRPLLVILTFPITILTLGLFLLVIHAGMFGFVAWLLGGFHVSGFFSALFGALIVSLTSTMASWFIGPDGRYQVLIIERREG
ncbi:MAG: phage holin family protein [Chromatiales bacterium]|nr:MAG: phage holin family protein [Chromatiales bacterium]